MPEDVKLPGLGNMKKTWVYAAVAAGGIVGIYYYRKRKAAATATSSQDAIDPQTGVPYSQEALDPATGFVSGTPQDLSALAAQGTTYAPGQAVSGAGGSNSYSYPSASYATNDAWAQGAEDYLVNVENQDAGSVGSAIAKYLSGEDLTSAEKNLVEMAMAIAGQPPVAGPNGYPPHIKEVATPAPPTRITLGAPRLSVAGGGRVGNRAKLYWTSVPHASFYTLYRNGAPDQSIVGTSYIFTEETRGVRWTVTARGGQGSPYFQSAQSNAVVVK